MLIKQLSIFVENKPGRLADITEVLAKANIDIRAISVADTTDFGILRLIVNKPDEACAALKEAGLAVTLTSVIAVGIDDEPGKFSVALRMLAEANIVVEYMYAFQCRIHGRAYVILRVDNEEKAIKVLTSDSQGVECISPERIYNM